MNTDTIVHIPLTGEESHVVSIPAGQGSLSIGTKGISKGKHEIWVEKDQPINWDAFNELYTPYGKQNMERYPYGDWPRFFYYSGNDMGFVEWSLKRPIEDFSWAVYDDVFVDLSRANIGRMFIHTEKNKIAILIGNKIRSLTLSGQLDAIEIREGSTIPGLFFNPLCSKEETVPYKLPVFEAFKDTKFIEVNCHPIGQALDCRSLLQFPDLTCLRLSGNLVHLEALAELKKLQSFQLRYVPDLTNLPELTCWKNLKEFIGWNIEETAGKVLRTEGRKLLKEEKLEFLSVTKLRKSIWFATEYGIPFAGWEDKKAKIATKAYKACLSQVKKAKTEGEVHDAIVNFVDAINKLSDIETSEREDTGTAVSQLIEASGLDIPQETGQKWFDEIRDF